MSQHETITTTHAMKVMHSCGHTATWHGGSAIGLFAKLASRYPCMCCGGEAGMPPKARPAKFHDSKRGWVCEVDGDGS